MEKISLSGPTLSNLKYFSKVLCMYVCIYAVREYVGYVHGERGA